MLSPRQREDPLHTKYICYRGWQGYRAKNHSDNSVSSPVCAVTKRQRCFSRGQRSAKPPALPSSTRTTAESWLCSRRRVSWAAALQCSGTTTTRCGGPSRLPKLRFSASTCGHNRRASTPAPIQLLSCPSDQPQIPQQLNPKLLCPVTLCLPDKRKKTVLETPRHNITRLGLT